MSNLKDKVLICKDCGSSKVKVTYGEDMRYPDDYVIECLNCLNWEQGNGAVGSFEVLDEPVKNREVEEMTKRPDIITCNMCESTNVSSVTSTDNLTLLECQDCENWDKAEYGNFTSFEVESYDIHKWEEELRMNKKDTNSGNKDRFMIDIDESTSIAISDMVTDCTKVMLEPFFNRIDPTIANADKLVSELERALLSELENYNKQRREEIENTKVYLLQGEDVVSVLDELDREDLIEDIDKLEDIVAYVDRKLEIPWIIYVSMLVEAYIDEEGL